jgi:hypothetical protein
LSRSKTDYQLADGSKAFGGIRLFMQLSLERDSREPNIRGTLQQIDGLYKDAVPPIE